MTAVASLRAPRASPPWTRALYGLLVQYRRTWRASVQMNFIYPVLYLTAMGVGLGHFVNHHLAASRNASLGGVSYLSFIAPGVLASSAMTIAIAECTWPVLGRFKWERSYLAMIQTPLEAMDVLTGQLAFVVLRLATTSCVFLAVMWAYGAVHSLWSLLTVPIGTLLGLAFATPCIAFTSTQQTDVGFPTINRLIVIPLFLFSGSFYPITQLPKALQWLALATPLYHGVALTRAATLGRLGTLPSLGHLGYLVVLAGGGLFVARRTFTRRLVK